MRDHVRHGMQGRETFLFAGMDVSHTLMVLPYWVAAGLLLAGAAYRERSPKASRAFVFLGASIILIWFLAGRFSWLVSEIVIGGVYFETAAANSRAEVFATYFPYVLVGLMLGLAPLRIASVFLRIISNSYARVMLEEDVAVWWLPGLRYLAMYTVVVAVVAAGIDVVPWLAK